MNSPEQSPAELIAPLPTPRAVRKAVILAAGRGRRMGQLTAHRPKAALSVGGHALLDWQIGALRAAGVENIAVVTGHGAGALAGRDVRYIHNPLWAAGTQVDSLLCAEGWIGAEPVIVSYGDILYHPSAALALRERPGDIIVAYDADHRWLWKRRFGDWLKDSETFRLAPGQVLAEIGGKPRDIDVVEGQFMGLMLMTPNGLGDFRDAFRALPRSARRSADFTAMLSCLVARGVRIDTAANLLPWIEIDSGKDLKVANAMAVRDTLDDRPAELCFSGELHSGGGLAGACGALAAASMTPGAHRRLPAAFRASAVVAVQNWGRSGSTLVQSLLDGHPQVVSTPNFYSRAYYEAWGSQICVCPDDAKIDAFMSFARQWWDPGLVDASAGLHRLGPERREVAGVARANLEQHLRAAFAGGAPITRRSLFEAAHVAYALALGRDISADDRLIVYPVHGRARGSACALLEDFPEARFLHTLRAPAANVAASIRHLTSNGLDRANDALLGALSNLFARETSGRDRLTRFGDRPYLGYLGDTDQLRFLPLEALHRSGPAAMTAMANWLGLSPAPSLMKSTFDAKTWWNRPESGSESRLGTIPSDGPAQDLLDDGDRACIALLTARSRLLRRLYPAGTESVHLGLVSRLVAALRPWRYERRARTPDLRALEALDLLRGCLPTRLRRQLRDALRFERKRAMLESQAHGAEQARNRLPHARHAETVRLVILLRDEGATWRLGLRLRPHSDPGLRAPDEVVVAAGDGATDVGALRRRFFWRVALTAGAVLAHARTFIRLRCLLMELLIWRWRRADPSAGRYPLFPAALNTSPDSGSAERSEDAPMASRPPS